MSGRKNRVPVPGVAELFRTTMVPPAAEDERQATGRERHDQKITVYLSADELLELEHARLMLRRFGFVVDRGRLVREAVAVLLADLDAQGAESLIVRRVQAGQGAGGARNAGPGFSGETVRSLAWARRLVRR
jgi:hypothetical protein